MKKLDIQLLLTGDELMSGDVLDSNSCMMADILKQKGLVFSRKVTVGDNLELLVREIERLSKDSDVLIINGGLGPTIDDKTAEALGVVVQQPLQEHPLALSQLQSWCESRGYELNGPNRKQALLPKGVDILHNPTGSAPGFSISYNDCLIMCTPGVPSEVKAMLQQSIMPVLDTMNPGAFTQVVRLQVFGMGESGMQRLITESLPDWPAEIELGFRAAFPQVEIKLTVHDQKAEQALPYWQKKVENLLGAHIIGDDDSQLPNILVNLLQSQKSQVTLAESCTGGLIAAKVTSVSGSSQVFEGGFVSYSNDIKMRLLNVKKETLQAEGAVSEGVVQEMAQGAIELSHAKWSIAVSGVAGPNGGTEDKPVGTVWIAWGQTGNIKTRKLFYPGSRAYFQEFIASAALDLLRRELLGIAEEPYYFTRK
jgi:nicotinamide-nucleotide amidase